ncbi:hypothetical protein FPG92_12730 [Flavobacterium psychrophilum]|nr:hypothetical protein FPG92_12730 [Flavobacterium psychrophilum]
MDFLGLFFFFQLSIFNRKKKKKNSAKKDTVAPTNSGSDRVKTGNEAKKKRAAIFLGCSLFCLQVVCGTEGGTTDWNSPAEQRKRPKGDRFFALLFRFGFSFYLIG